MTIHAIIFDLEGVLLITKEKNISETLSKKLGFPVESIKKLFHSEMNDLVDVGGATQEDYWDYMLEELGLPEENRSDLYDFFYNDFFIDQELLTIIRDLRRTFQTGLLTNFSDVLRPMLENEWSVAGAFDEILISWEEKVIKPNPAIYERMLSRLKREPQEAVFIDDRLINVDGARAIGMHAILFENKAQALDDLQQLLETPALVSSEWCQEDAIK